MEDFPDLTAETITAGTQHLIDDVTGPDQMSRDHARDMEVFAHIDRALVELRHLETTLDVSGASLGAILDARRVLEREYAAIIRRWS